MNKLQPEDDQPANVIRLPIKFVARPKLFLLDEPEPVDEGMAALAQLLAAPEAT